MSGHSKWANIKNKKEKTDAQKGKIFTKLGREIVVAVKQGGPDPESNSKLKDVIAKCKANNMPNDNIERSIKKAAGAEDTSNYEEIVYEGYGPNGVAIIVEATTDNKNRTAADVRHLFDKFGGNLGTSGCVSYMFNKKGVIIVEKNDTINEDDLMMMSLELGAEDFNVEEEYYEIITETSTFSAVMEGLEKEGIKFTEADIQMIPSTYVALTEEQSQKLEKLVNNLEDNDDVSQVWTNAE